MSYGEWMADNDRRRWLVTQAKYLSDRVLDHYRKYKDDRILRVWYRTQDRVQRRLNEYQTNLSHHGLQLREQYGNVQLSIVAGYGLYCIPNNKIGPYTLVECAIISDSGEFLTPDDVGIADEEIIERHDGSAIFGYVPWPVVDKIRDYLRKRAENEV